MTGSNSRQTVALLITGALAWAAPAPVPALAQPASPPPTGAPLILTPQRPDAAAPVEPDALPPGARSLIAVDPLAPPTPDGMGLVDTRSGGFPESMWRDSRAETARVLVAELPRGYAGLGARRLAQRFLLSAAPPPAEPEPDRGGAPSGSAFLEARVSALARMGDWQNALALIDLVPAETRTPALTRLRVDGLLMEGRIDAACGDAQRLLATQPDGHWQKVQVYCQFAAGQASAANLGLALLREQGVEDPMFFWAAEALQAGAGSPPTAQISEGEPSPLVLAMLRKTGRPLPLDIFSRQTPSVLRVAAQIATTTDTPETPAAPPGKAPVKPKPALPDAELDARIAVVEQAVLAGVADIAALRALYAAMPDAKTSGTADGSIVMDTPLQRAATYKLAAAQTVPTAKAEVIERALSQTRTRAPGPVLTALVYAPMVQQLPTAADLAWFAGSAVRILLAAETSGVADQATPGAGVRAQVQSWFDLARGMAATSQEVAPINAGLWPYRQLLAGGQFSRQDMGAWLDTLAPAAADSAETEVAGVRALTARDLMLNLLAGVGDGVTAADWLPLLAATPTEVRVSTAPSAVWHSLAVATRDKRVGEAVALALHMMAASPAPREPLAIAHALEGLAAAGRIADARALALEMALQRGL
jgi:hypothetical protein